MAQKDLGRVVGYDGITPHIGSNKHWFIGDADTGILAEGTDGHNPIVTAERVDTTVTLKVDGVPVATIDDGTPGVTGPRGDTGATGPKGDKGDKGDTGDTGQKGDTGPQGPKGDKGEQGPKGDKGDKGDTGAGFKVLGYYSTVFALQAAVPSPTVGDAYGIGAAEPYDIYIYSETNGWVNNGPLQGATGATGPKGDKGDPGATGATGPKGDKGDPGATGATGPKGDKGDPGATGATGPKGDKGDPGATGATGPKGDKGDPGATGSNGKSAYQYAKEAGYSGTEAEFAQMLASAGSGEGSGASVGDMLTTARTDMGNTWLLCNGEQVSALDYAELAKLFPMLPNSWVASDVYGSSSSSNKLGCVTYANGYWVACGQYVEGSTYYARIAYTTDPAGSWTTKDLWSADSVELNCVTYANGYWAVCGYAYDGFEMVAYARIAYTTDLAGSWTTKDLWSAEEDPNYVLGTELNCITYANGYWAVCGQYCEFGDYASYDIRIAYTTNLAGSWTVKNLDSTETSDDGLYQSNTAERIIYANGYWAVCGTRYYGDYFYASVWYSEDIGGDWRVSTLWQSDGQITEALSVAYGNGYWVACGSRGCGEYSKAYVAYATNLAGPWETERLWTESSTSAHVTVNGIAYANGYWVACGWCDGTRYHQARIAYTTDPAGTWETKDLWSGSKNCEVKCVSYQQGKPMVAVGVRYDGSQYYGEVAYCDSDVFVLPAISIGNAYTYIKAKEG